MTADILAAARAPRAVPAELVRDLFIAPDNAGDEVLWRKGAEGDWPEYIAERDWLPGEVWAILAAVLPREATR